MNQKIRIPTLSKLFLVISLAGIIWSIIFAYKLNFISQDYTETELLRLNLLIGFIFSISSLACYKTIHTFKTKKIDSKVEINAKIDLIKKFAEIERLGIISETDCEVQLIYKTKFLGFYKLFVLVNQNSFEFNVFEHGGKPFDWGIRKKLLNKFADYIIKFECASL
jgi:hypothetical protein